MKCSACQEVITDDDSFEFIAGSPYCRADCAIDEAIRLYADPKEWADQSDTTKITVLELVSTAATAERGRIIAARLKRARESKRAEKCNCPWREAKGDVHHAIGCPALEVL